MVITNTYNTQKVHDIITKEDIGSDHVPIMVSINEKPLYIKPTTTHKPNFEKADWNLFMTNINEEMEHAPPVREDKDTIDQAIQFITKTIQAADKKAIPRTRINPPGSKPLPDYILGKIKERREMIRISKDRRHYIETRQQAKSVANHLQKEIVIYSSKFM